MENKKININKYIISDNKLTGLLDNLETKVPKGYITIEGNNARTHRQTSSKIKKTE